jgi:hypothetical protein
MSATAQIVTGRKVYLGGVVMSGDENDASMNLKYDEKEGTTFPDAAHLFKPGLPSVELSQKGFVAYGVGMVDEAIVAKLGAAAAPLTITQQSGLANEIAYFLNSRTLQYQKSLNVGELPSFTLGMKLGSDYPHRGTILLAATELSAGTTNTTARQLGALVSGKKAWVVLHVLTKSGSPTVDVVIESDNAVGFSSPTTQITCTQFTDVGAEIKSLAVATSDDYWRAAITVAGTGTPKATVFIALEIEQ